MDTFFYVLSMRGCKPTYYTQYEAGKAYGKYLYMSKHFSGVSLTRASWRKVIKDYIVTGRTA